MIAVGTQIRIPVCILDMFPMLYIYIYIHTILMYNYDEILWIINATVNTIL